MDARLLAKYDVLLLNYPAELHPAHQRPQTISTDDKVDTPDRADIRI
jgi:hypothetical protein